MPILHCFRDINTYSPKIKTSRNLNHAQLEDSLSSSQYFMRQPAHKIWWFYLQPLHTNLRGCKILQWIMWPGPRLFRDGRSSEC